MIRVFSRTLSPGVVGVILYAFRVDPSNGKPLEEIASAWENYPEKVDHSTKGRRWPDNDTGLRRRTDSAARVMLATLEETYPGKCREAPHYWRTSVSQRFRQERSREAAELAARVYLAREVGAAGFAPDRIAGEVDNLFAGAEIIDEQTYIGRGFTVWSIE